MLYAILCYNQEDTVGQWTKEEDDAVMARLDAVLQPVERSGRLGPVARLLPTTAATTLRKAGGEPLVIDGPFAETKEQFLGFYLVDFDTLDEALAFSKDLADLGLGDRPRCRHEPFRQKLGVGPAAEQRVTRGVEKAGKDELVFGFGLGFGGHGDLLRDV